MSPHRDDLDLVAELESLRPAPDPEFAHDLDVRAAEGFPRTTPDGSPAPERWRDRLAGFRWGRMIAPAGAVAVAAIAIATAVVSLSETEPGGGRDTAVAVQERASAGHPSERAAPRVTEFSQELPVSPSAAAPAAAEAISAAGAPESLAAQAQSRKIERSAQVVLEAEPSEVRTASSRVFGVVRDHDGIVLRSAVRDRENGASVATFDLLIPSGELDEALAEFSEIATVRSRSDSTADVTAPTVGLQERLRDVQGNIDRLLTELAEAETDVDREAIERRLRTERARADYLRSRLRNLEERVRFSRVSLRIVAAEGAGSAGSWGVDDAVDDAGRILGVAAGVTLIGLAVLAPLALIALLAWAASRAWARKARERALDRTPTTP